MPDRKSSSKKLPSSKSKKNVSQVQTGGIAMSGTVTCADLVGGDKITTYGYSATDVEHLIEKVLTLLNAGASFLPSGGPSSALRAEMNGEILTFHPAAMHTLAGCRSERAYLLSLTVRREYQIWGTKFIPLAARVDVRQAITDIPVAYSAYIPAPTPDAPPRMEPLEDITNALTKHSAFIILGEPGSGKTTTLQKIAFEQSRAILEGMAGRVPVFVRLSQQKDRLPFDFLRAEWEQRTGTDLAESLAQGRVLLLADGVNELPREERAERLKDWRLLTDEYAGANQIVFTGRERDYDAELNLPRVRVDSLDDTRIKEYLRRQDALGLAALLDDPRTHLRDMARNPFNLSLLVFAYRSNQREMANRGGLLRWFTGELFGREERMAHRGWLPREVQTHALAQLANTLQARGEGTTVDEKTARAALPEVVEWQGEPIPVRPGDLWRFARAATLLDPAVVPDIRFYHQLLQEYFAALELSRLFEAGRDFSNVWRVPRRIDEMPASNAGDWDPLPEPPGTGWEVTTILAVSLTPRPEALVEAVRIHNPALAARCLLESGRNWDATIEMELKRKLQSDLLTELYDPQMHLRTRLQAGFALGKIGDPRFPLQTLNEVKVILPQMVNIPAGVYLIGCPPDEPDSYDDEKPEQLIELPAYAIGKWPVTNAEYACFVEAGGYEDEQWWKTDAARSWLRGGENANPEQPPDAQADQPGLGWKERLVQSGNLTEEQLAGLNYYSGLPEGELKIEVEHSFWTKSRKRPEWWSDPDRNNPSQPVVGITWYEACAYCEWLSSVTGRRHRLPTEVEWEAAARGFPEPLADGWKARYYPWGDTWDSEKANTIEGRVLKPSPVGAYTAVGNVGPFGTEDQAGNVWNWTSSLFLLYPYSPASEDPSSTEERVHRGGAWYFPYRGARCGYRTAADPAGFFNRLGFRMVSPEV
jgi:formylglycine-generating enzyme required for sulfatase activity